MSENQEKDQEFLCETCYNCRITEFETLICNIDNMLLDDNKDYNDMFYECKDYNETKALFYLPLDNILKD